MHTCTNIFILTTNICNNKLYRLWQNFTFRKAVSLSHKTTEFSKIITAGRCSFHSMNSMNKKTELENVWYTSPMLHLWNMKDKGDTTRQRTAWIEGYIKLPKVAFDVTIKSHPFHKNIQLYYLLVSTITYN